MRIVPPSTGAAFLAAVAATITLPSAAGAVAPVLHPQEVPAAAVQEDTIRSWVPCRRTLASCVSKTLGAMQLAPGEVIEMDGLLDEELWARAAFTSDFTQRDPNPGAAPTERTEFAFVYTETALYIGARMYAQDPSQIRAILSRRDEGGDSERIIVNIDSYQDRRAYYSIAVTAAGTAPRLVLRGRRQRLPRP